MKHRDQVLALLKKQIGNSQEVADIEATAEKVASRWVNPTAGGKGETNGLIYGLVQSGKTGVLTVTGAVGADEGYRTLIVLTSDIDPLYEQTLDRVRESFPGIDIIGKSDFKDLNSFLQRIKGGTCAIVATKNSAILGTLEENFKKGNVKGLSCLIIDDEADQASLNTKEKKADGSQSAINEKISNLRKFFEKNTYLQVTATPQALFLQTPVHAFRPKFTVLSHPGSDYVGGGEFFADNSDLVKEFDILDIALLTAGSQPSPTMSCPKSLLRALDTFMVGATFKRMKDADQNCAFLCHVSTKNDDHKHIERVLRTYKMKLQTEAKAGSAPLKKRLQEAYDDLATTHPGLRGTSVDKIFEALEFFSPGIAVKLVNGQTDEDVAVRSPYNLFVGGNKLGRGVTIKNLLVSYYGRNPKVPQADTVLQHARMYGYRRKDLGLLRLFLPRELHLVFKAIHKMEEGLRELIERAPTEEFRGVFIEGKMKATRPAVLAPGAVGIYAGGGNYNPAQVKRDASVTKATAKIDALVNGVPLKTPVKVSIDLLRQLVELTQPDPNDSELIWDELAVSESMAQYAIVMKQKEGYLYIDTERGLKEKRRETQGILEGGEHKLVPDDRLTLFLLRTKKMGASEPAWWPQLRFAKGQYAFAFTV